jgi:hypothetical protein
MHFQAISRTGKVVDSGSLKRVPDPSRDNPDKSAPAPVAPIPSPSPSKKP